MSSGGKLSVRLLRRRGSGKDEEGARRERYRRCNSDPSLTNKLVKPINADQQAIVDKAVPHKLSIARRLKKAFSGAASDSLRHSMIDESLTAPELEGRLSFTSTSTGYSSARSSVRSSHVVGGSSASGSPKSTFSVDTHTDDVGDGLSYLQRIGQELMETEKSYVGELQSVIEGYLNPLLRCRRRLGLTTVDVSHLFGCIENVFDFNIRLLDALRGTRGDMLLAAEAFLHLDQGFAVYESYCALYPKMLACFDRLSAEEKLSTFLCECQRSLGHDLPLGTYLLKPIQRVLKYHLFLQNAVEHWPSGRTMEIRRLRLALRCMRDRAEMINQVKRREEHSGRIAHLQQMIGENRRTDKLQDYGELLLEAVFKLLFTKHQSRRLLLFEEVLLVCKEKPDGSLQCKDFILCSHLTLYKSVTNCRLSFQISDGAKAQFAFETRTEEQRSQWVDEMCRIIRQNTGTPLDKNNRRFAKGGLRTSTRAPRYVDIRRQSSDGASQSDRRISMFDYDADYSVALDGVAECSKSASTSELWSPSANSKIRGPRASSIEPTANLDDASNGNHRTMPETVVEPPPVRRPYGEKGRSKTSAVTFRDEGGTDIETSFAELWHDLQMFAADTQIPNQWTPNNKYSQSLARSTPRFPLNMQQTTMVTSTHNVLPTPPRITSTRNALPTPPRSTGSDRRVPPQFLAAEHRLAALVARKAARREGARGREEGDYDDDQQHGHLGVVRSMVKEWQTENI